ncbi:MAG: hypothetical protein IJ526_10600 [Lachnospiraceae bacterium]|nr:hypothetical protein [Lachnospiraceae bacterium]
MTQKNDVNERTIENIMKIRAHRECSQRFPENTITTFDKARVIPGPASLNEPEKDL